MPREHCSIRCLLRPAWLEPEQTDRPQARRPAWRHRAAPEPRWLGVCRLGFRIGDIVSGRFRRLVGRIGRICFRIVFDRLCQRSCFRSRGLFRHRLHFRSRLDARIGGLAAERIALIWLVGRRRLGLIRRSSRWRCCRSSRRWLGRFGERIRCIRRCRLRRFLWSFLRGWCLLGSLLGCWLSRLGEWVGCVRRRGFRCSFGASFGGFLRSRFGGLEDILGVVASAGGFGVSLTVSFGVSGTTAGGGSTGFVTGGTTAGDGSTAGGVTAGGGTANGVP